MPPAEDRFSALEVRGACLRAEAPIVAYRIHASECFKDGSAERTTGVFENVSYYGGP